MWQFRLPWKSKIEVPENENDSEQKSLEQIDEPDTIVVANGANASSSISFLDTQNVSYENVKAMIKNYRWMSTNFEVDEALDEIENDAVVVENDESITINTDRLEFSDNIKKKIDEEFNNILILLDWNSNGSTIFRQWFIDGRKYFQKVMYKNLRKGIKKIVDLDTLKLKKVKDEKTFIKYYEYEYNDVETWKIPEEAIAYVPSGILNETKKYYVSELQRSYRPLNILRLIEDSALIYYITRAPQKRVFYVDIGNTPTKKADEVVKKIMNKNINRLSYDSAQGKIIQQKKSVPVNEDYYLPTRGDTRGTKIDTLDGDTNLLDTEILNYFKKKLYKSLSVPYARVDDDQPSTIDFGNGNDISRQELKMSKQTKKRRKRFSVLFDDLLKTQLISKKIIAKEDWSKIKHSCFYVWKDDSYFTMIKEQQILKGQIEVAESLEPFIGKYFSHEFTRKFVFKQSDQDIENIDKQIEDESKDKKYEDENVE